MVHPEPGVRAGIEQHEQARLGAARAARAMAGGLAPPRRGEAGRPEEALDGGPAHSQPLDLDELLGEVHVVEAGVLRLGQRQDLRPRVGQQHVGGNPAVVAVGQGRRAARPQLGAQAPHLPLRQG